MGEEEKGSAFVLISLAAILGMDWRSGSEWVQGDQWK